MVKYQHFMVLSCVPQRVHYTPSEINIFSVKETFQCFPFHMKMPPGFDRTASTATSTLNSLVEPYVQLVACFLCFFFFFLWVLRAPCGSCSRLSSQLKGADWLWNPSAENDLKWSLTEWLPDTQKLKAQQSQSLAEVETFCIFCAWWILTELRDRKALCRKKRGFCTNILWFLRFSFKWCLILFNVKLSRQKCGINRVHATDWPRGLVGHSWIAEWCCDSDCDKKVHN